MKKLNFFCNCTTCGEPLTSPIFHLGKPYGWSCASKLFPTLKKPKKTNYVKAESFVITDGSIESGVFKIVAIYEGKKYGATFYRTSKAGVIYYSSPGMQYDEGSVYFDIDAFQPKKRSLSTLTI